MACGGLLSGHRARPFSPSSPPFSPPSAPIFLPHNPPKRPSPTVLPHPPPPRIPFRHPPHRFRHHPPHLPPPQSSQTALSDGPPHPPCPRVLFRHPPRRFRHQKRALDTVFCARRFEFPGRVQRVPPTTVSSLAATGGGQCRVNLSGASSDGSEGILKRSKARGYHRYMTRENACVPVLMPVSDVPPVFLPASLPPEVEPLAAGTSADGAPDVSIVLLSEAELPAAACTDGGRDLPATTCHGDVTTPDRPKTALEKAGPVRGGLIPTELADADPEWGARVARRREMVQLGDRIAELSSRIQAATYELLVLIREFDAREGWDGCRSCAHWLGWRTGLRLGAAREKVRVAHALADLPQVSDAMRRGRISYSKVRAITRVATPATEASLLNIALSGTASHVERVVRGWRRAGPAGGNGGGRAAKGEPGAPDLGGRGRDGADRGSVDARGGGCGPTRAGGGVRPAVGGGPRG